MTELEKENPKNQEIRELVTKALMKYREKFAQSWPRTLMESRTFSEMAIEEFRLSLATKVQALKEKSNPKGTDSMRQWANHTGYWESCNDILKLLEEMGT